MEYIVDLFESFQMSLSLPMSTSMQPRTSLSELGEGGGGGELTHQTPKTNLSTLASSSSCEGTQEKRRLSVRQKEGLSSLILSTSFCDPR